MVLCFFGSAGQEASRRILADISNLGERFDDVRACFFGVSTDPDDLRMNRVRGRIPGIRFFWDFDLAISRLYGAVPDQGNPSHSYPYHPFTLVLDQRLRVLACLPFAQDHVQRLSTLLDGLPDPGHSSSQDLHAPVLIVPRIFEPEFCTRLIRLYHTHGGTDSGFMREVNGKTTGQIDYRHKRRSDYAIQEQDVRQAARARIQRRLLPEVEKAFQFKVTRMERDLIACYDSAIWGHFRPHRDNTTRGTAHRRFAVTINLNTEDYEGGDLVFPEFGQRTYRAPTGGAVVFSCSLLHEAKPVTRGCRYAFLPFLYDEEAARIREANNEWLDESVGRYAMGDHGNTDTASSRDG